MSSDYCAAFVLGVVAVASVGAILSPYNHAAFGVTFLLSITFCLGFIFSGMMREE